MSHKRILVITMASVVSLSASLSMAADSAKSSKAKKSEATAATPAATQPQPPPPEKPAEASKESDKAPRLTIVEPVKDYGTVAKGEKLDWSFVVKNTGDADLQIIAAKPGCGCTVADFDKVVKPGETGKVNTHVDTTNFAGPIAKSVTLETNDPSTPTSTLTIHAVVKPYVEAFPAGFVRFNLLEGDADTQSVKIYSEEEEPFEVKSVEGPGDWVKTAFHKIAKAEDQAPGVGKPGQNQYQIDITVGGPDVKVGPLADKVHITTNSKHQPDYYISLSGVVRPTYRVDPTNVNFGEVAPSDSAATRSVRIHTNDQKTPDKFVVTKVESSTPLVTAAVKEGANKGDFEVTLQISKNAKPGDVDGKVKIFTSDKINPVVEVPIRGTVKSDSPAAGQSAK